ncbi:PKD domain-containing protein [Tenuifilum thalassicum]|uniref:PKD domain-containing protein n=1 Tax=Tenuifilum thalassicum TaxID=2590900 RepID=A0A7D4BDN1_9BACT|nr:PKD domain-containing protein [Tenuifilum thalassicum]QKG79458.1 PKD domain-containing protein [Tenuifilum thalassicum]
MRYKKHFQLAIRGVTLVSLIAFIFTACEDDSYTYLFTDKSTPVSKFTPVINGFDVEFQNQSEHATTYFWDFGDGTTSTDTNAVHSYSQKNKYMVKLIASDNNGVTDTAVQEVAVGYPLASFTYVANKTTVTFTNTSINANSYSWDFGDGTTSTEENPTHTFPDGGTYTVALTASDGVDNNTFTQDVFVVAKYQPVIKSPSFEGSTSVYRNEETGWYWVGCSGSSSPTPPDGTNACKFGSAGNLIAQTFEVEANTDYILSYYWVTKAGGTIGIKIKVTDGTDHNVILYEGQTGVTPNASEYQSGSFEFNSGSSTSVRLWFEYGDVESRLDMITIK